jgi:penicillin-binding protein 2
MGGQEGVLLLATVPEGRRLAGAGTLALADQPFPAGSVFKVVTAFAAAQELPLDLSQTIPCRGVYRVGQKRFYCSVPGGHGPLSLVEALAQSCNVHFYVLARRIGPATLARYALQLGWPAHRLDLTDTGDAEGTLRFGIGQRGVTITPREMLDWVVHLARNVSASTAAGPAATGTLRERQAFQVIAQGLRQAVAQGTARRASLPDVAVAAKTGSPTSVQDPTRLQAWCVGYAPAEAPEVAFVVFVKDGMGGTTAAPLAGSVLRACFHPFRP